MIALPKPPGAPGSLSDTIYVTETEVKQTLAGIAARHKIRDDRFKEFAKQLEQKQVRTTT